MLEQAIADFYASMLENGTVIVFVDGEKYYIGKPGSGIAFAREEIEWAEMTTTLPVEYVEV